MVNENLLNKYAKLLVDYSLSLEKGDKLLIKSTTLAEPLVKAVYKEALICGAIVEVDLDFEDKGNLLLKYGQQDALVHKPSLFEKAINEFDAYLNIRAPFSLKLGDVDKAKRTIHQKAMEPIFQTYFDRTADRRLKRSLCQYPTQAAADAAEMTLEEYSAFIFSACKLNEENPKKAWIGLRKNQQAIVDKLNSCTHVRYQSPHMDISFRTEGRTWINSDGQTNMPSGEVFTSPIEDSANGYITFTYPAIYRGVEVEQVKLEVKDGYIESWTAAKGQEFLDEIFKLKGSRRFGEAAIGTNYDINRITKNILFDEKIGGSIHMAIGQSYAQAGGKNNSSIHWDMISDMRNGGEVFADGEKIYENGQFLI
jgi:aminopeptidase